MKEEHRLAQSIKISILRLAYITEHGGVGDLESADFAFGEDQLVLVLGRMNTEESRNAFIELFDYQLPDTVWDAIAQVTSEYQNDLIPLFKARIGTPIAESPYLEVVTQEERDRQLENWISELSSNP
ncbi:hypothetical protein CAI21_16600 [Alkalilimnicola ehrlichii]|uniref:Uncharacterized protein n=1 Tax=Alkalilimnicola ehrlichii TaxID=351052 RepID=A0A3E0WLU9_9GAMM|nr:hypothetical protein [Alkalilimnicola ehrlichii]RFA26583.1 hypothetical protein CAI21_16600 [Alkalilimnicola ehrlichii]RFA32915.1 hypothetical protein CAL65_18395 [Alkalilimnicola ehrlichii]